MTDQAPATARSQRALRNARLLTALFMGALIISGLTAFPLEWGTGVLVELTGLEADSETEALGALERWLLEVHEGLTATNEK